MCLLPILILADSKKNDNVKQRGKLSHRKDNHATISGTSTVAETTPTVPLHFNIVSDYFVGIPFEVSKQSWFHGSMTEKQAEAQLSIGSKNRQFLVRHTTNALILSSRIGANSYHDIIGHGPDGYCLKGKHSHFKSVVEMIAYYGKVPIDQKHHDVLGYACSGIYSGKQCV